MKKKVSSILLTWILLSSISTNNVLSAWNDINKSILQDWTVNYEDNKICSIWENTWNFNDQDIIFESEVIWSFIHNKIQLNFDNSWKTIKEWDYFDIVFDEKVKPSWINENNQKLNNIVDWDWKVILISHYDSKSNSVRYIFTNEIENIDKFNWEIELYEIIDWNKVSKDWTYEFTTKIWEKTFTKSHEINYWNVIWWIQESQFIRTKSLLLNKDSISWRSKSHYLFEAKEWWNLVDWQEKIYFEYITNQFTEWNKEPNSLSNETIKVFKLKNSFDTNSLEYSQDDIEMEVTNEIIETEWKINWQKAFESEFTISKWEKYIIVLENDNNVTEENWIKTYETIVWLHLTTVYKGWWIILDPPFNWDWPIIIWEPPMIIPKDWEPEIIEVLPPNYWTWEIIINPELPEIPIVEFPVEWSFIVDTHNKVTQVLNSIVKSPNLNIQWNKENWKDIQDCFYWKKVSILKQDNQWNVLSNVNFSIKKDKEYLKDWKWEKMIFSTWNNWKFVFETEIWSSYEFFEEQFDWIDKYEIVPWAFVKSLDIRMNSKNWEEYTIVNKLKTKEEPKDPEKPIEENPVKPDEHKPIEPKKPETPSITNNPTWPGWYVPPSTITEWWNNKTEVPVNKTEDKEKTNKTENKNNWFIFEPKEEEIISDFKSYSVKLPKTWWEITQEEINRKVWKKNNKKLETELIKDDFKNVWSNETNHEFWLNQLSKDEYSKYWEFLVIPSEWLVMPLDVLKNEEKNEKKLWSLMTKSAIKLDYMTKNWSSNYWENWTKFIWWHSSYFKWKSFWKYKTHFQKIIWLEMNDKIFIYKKDENWNFNKFVYKVNSSYNIENWNDLRIDRNLDDLVLFTCTPIWWTTWRWIVHATIEQ